MTPFDIALRLLNVVEDGFRCRRDWVQTCTTLRSELTEMEREVREMESGDAAHAQSGHSVLALRVGHSDPSAVSPSSLPPMPRGVEFTQEVTDLYNALARIDSPRGSRLAHAALALIASHLRGEWVLFDRVDRAEVNLQKLGVENEKLKAAIVRHHYDKNDVLLYGAVGLEPGGKGL